MQARRRTVTMAVGVGAMLISIGIVSCTKDLPPAPGTKSAAIAGQAVQIRPKSVRPEEKAFADLSESSVAEFGGVLFRFDWTACHSRQR
jgi:hypothetical protein